MARRRLPRRHPKRLSKNRRSARAERESRRRKVYLLSLQDLPPEKLEKLFRKIVDGEVDLIGLREKPKQRPSRFLLMPEKNLF